MGESDFPVDEAALFYSPRPPEELEEYTWVSQTSLQTRLLSSLARDRQRSPLPKPKAGIGTLGIHVGESDLPKDLAALFQSPRLTEELEEYRWVSQTYLGTWLLSSIAQCRLVDGDC
jgi:hypothetical protein